MTEYAKPLPVITELTAPFWEAARAGRLEVQRCDACGTLRFPPARVCDACLSEQTSWVPVSGRATVWSVCEFHRLYFKGFEPELPYNVALVCLEEGPRMYTNLVGIDYDQIQIGMPVQVAFEPVTDAVSLIKFRPA